MAIQGTQVPMYTKHTLFLYFSDFSIFFIWKKKKLKTTNKNMLSKANHKTRLTQNKSKTHKLCKNKNTRRKKKVIESLGALFLPRLGRTFHLIKPLNWRWGGRIETIQFRKEHEGFKKISKGSKRGLKLILASRCYHAVALFLPHIGRTFPLIKPLNRRWRGRIETVQVW